MSYHILIHGEDAEQQLLQWILLLVFSRTFQAQLRFDRLSPVVVHLLSLLAQARNPLSLFKFHLAVDVSATYRQSTSSFLVACVSYLELGKMWPWVLCASTKYFSSWYFSPRWCLIDITLMVDKHVYCHSFSNFHYSKDKSIIAKNWERARRQIGFRES